MSNKLVLVVEGDFGPDEKLNDIGEVMNFFTDRNLDISGYADGVWHVYAMPMEDE